MNTGSQDERIYLNDVHRIAEALEKIAKALAPKPTPVEDLLTDNSTI